VTTHGRPDEGRSSKLMAAVMAAVDAYLADEASRARLRPSLAWRMAAWRPMRTGEPGADATWRGRN